MSEETLEPQVDIQLNRAVQVADVIEALMKLPPDQEVLVLGAGPILGVFGMEGSEGEEFVVLSSAGSTEQLDELSSLMEQVILASAFMELPEEARNAPRGQGRPMGEVFEEMDAQRAKFEAQQKAEG